MDSRITSAPLELDSVQSNRSKSASLETPEDLALDTIVSIALAKCPDTIPKSSLDAAGKRFFDALCFLSRSDPLLAAKELHKVLKIRDHGRCRIKMALLVFDVIDMDTFQVLAIMALNHVPSTYSEKGTSVMLYAFLSLFDFMKPRSPYSVFVTKTAYNIMKKHLHGVDLRAPGRLILSVANTFMTLSPYSKAVDYIDKMSNIIIKSWSEERRSAEIKTLFNMASWDNCDCHLISCFVNNWPEELDILPYVELIGKRTSVMLTQKNLKKGAMKILEATVKNIDIETWYELVVFHLLKLLPPDVERQRSYMKNILMECASLAVQQFGGPDSYDYPFHVFDDDLDMKYYLVLVLYCGVNDGSIDIFDTTKYTVDKHLRILVESKDDNLEYFAMKTFCIFNNKRSVLPPWQVRCIFNQIKNRNSIFDDDTIEDLYYFLSHLCVKTNEIITSRCKRLESYFLFFAEAYDICMLMIKSKDPRLIVLGAQIFTLIRSVMEGSSSSLKLKYKLPEQDQYAEEESPTYKALMSREAWCFRKIETWDKIYEEFMDNAKVYPAIFHLILKWFEGSLPRRANHTSHIFFKGLDLLRAGYNNESAEKGRCCIEIALHDEAISNQLCRMMVTVLEKELVSESIVMHSYEDMMNILTHSAFFGLTKGAFCLLKHKGDAVPHKYVHLLFIHSDVMIRTILSVISTEEGQEFFDTPSKIVEHTLIVCMEVMMAALRIIWDGMGGISFKECVEVSNMIIETSNMKKPVTTAAILVRRLCMEVLMSHYDRAEVIIIKFLEYVLFSIYAAPSYLTSKIRRNPEHRLMIHALVVADQRPNHPFLARAMEFLLGVLSDDSSMSGSIASALNSVEIVLSDNSLRISTLPFVSSVMVHCVNAFSSKDWQIKNAAMQVLKSVADRILGQKINLLCRYHSVEDAFLMFPELSVYFYSTLHNVVTENIRESTIAILAVFSESHRKCTKFLSRDILIVTECFLKIFQDFICTDASPIGVFAAKAYAALYPHLCVPFIMCDIVDCLILKFAKMKKNIFYTFLCLLQALYERFNFFSYVPYHKVGLTIIESSVQTLTKFLQNFNKLYEFSLYSLLSVKSNSVNNVEEALVLQLPKGTYQSRLWLNNNVPYLLKRIEIKRFPNVLNTCLGGKFSLSVKIHCLRSVANRYLELVQNSLVDATLVIIFDAFLELTFTVDYLVISFSNVIFLLNETCDFVVSENLLTRLRCNYKLINKNNIYFVSVCLCLLSCISSFTETDQIFVTNAIVLYQNATFIEDPELNYHASSTLKYLYKCVQISDRYEVLKLAFILLLNDDTSFEIQKFVAELFNVQLSSTFETLEVLTSYHRLVTELGNAIKACGLLIDLTIFISSLKDGFEDNGKFYLKQNSDICLHKYPVKSILLEKVKSAFKMIPRNSCCQLLYNVQYILK